MTRTFRQQRKPAVARSVWPVGDRSSPKEWLENDRPDLVSKAIGRKDTLLASHCPVHIPEATDAAIRECYAIVLPCETMLPAA